jgi:hypothetical protein
MEIERQGIVRRSDSRNVASCPGEYTHLAPPLEDQHREDPWLGFSSHGYGSNGWAAPTTTVPTSYRPRTPSSSQTPPQPARGYTPGGSVSPPFVYGARTPSFRPSPLQQRLSRSIRRRQEPPISPWRTLQQAATPQLPPRTTSCLFQHPPRPFAPHRRPYPHLYTTVPGTRTPM